MGHDLMKHHTLDAKSTLKRKFRMWRCDIPRDNYHFETYPVKKEEETEIDYNTRVAIYNLWLASENNKGIFRHSRRSMDRMRNSWIYLKLEKVTDTTQKCEIHDLVMTYFN